MKPASAISFALKKPGRSAARCAFTGTDFAAVAVIAANAAERRRSRFVIIVHSSLARPPLGGQPRAEPGRCHGLRRPTASGPGGMSQTKGPPMIPALGPFSFAKAHYFRGCAR